MLSTRARTTLWVALSLLLVLSAPQVVPAAYVGSWFWQNPIPQGGDLYAIDFAGDVGWAVGDQAVLRTMNGGAQWAVQYGVPEVSSRIFVNVDMTDSNTVWITATDGSVLVSNDGGETWEDRRPAGIVSAWEIEFVDEYRGWISDGYLNTWCTVDAGQTWSPVSLPAMSAGGNFYRYQDRLLVTAGTDVCSIDTSTGAVEKIGTVPGWGVNDIAFVDGDHLVAVTDMGKFTRSGDGGRTWTALKPVSSSAMDLSNVFFVSSQVGYTNNGSRVWKTTDGGATWSSFSPAIRNRTGTLVSTPLAASDVAAGPGRLFLVGSAGRIMYSLDKGVSWRYISGDFFNNLVDVSFENTTSGLALAENAAFRTSDGGATWSRQTMPSVRQFTAVSIAPNRKGWVVGTDRIETSPYITGVLFRTGDGGRTFTKQSVPKCVELLDVWTNDGVTGWAAGNSNVILKTTDGGVTWRKATIDWSGVAFDYPEEDRPIHSVVVLPNGLGYANASNEGYVLRTTNGGTTWRAVEVRKPGAVTMVGTDTVLVGGWDGAIRRNQYPDPTWTTVTLPDHGGQMVQAIEFLTPAVGYAACGNHVYRTEDGGQTWFSTWSGPWIHRFATAGGTDAWGVGSGGAVLYNGGLLGDFTPPVTRTSAPLGWDDADYAYVSLTPSDQTGIDSTWWTFGEPPAEDPSQAVAAAASSGALTYSPYKGRIKIAAEGVTAVTFYSRDANGNLEQPRTVRVRLDRRRPTVSSNAQPTYGGSATIKLTATDAGSGVKAVYYSLDGRRTVGRSGATAYVKAGLGKHRVTYWAVDRLGHVSYKTTKYFTVKPRASLSAPSAPTTTTVGVSFVAAGYLYPRHLLSAPVLIRTYRYDEATASWLAGPYVRTYTRNNAVGSRYSARLSLPTAGRWKIVATHSDAVHYYSLSTARYTTCVDPVP